MNRLAIFLLAFASIALPATAAPALIVRDGQPVAEIVIADAPLRTVRLAAQELQDGLEKISGAHVPIVRRPTPGTTHLFVGRSTFTDRLKVATDDLRDGAYRLVSGQDWLALVGLDTEFTPTEPWAKNNDDLRSGRTQAAWDAITGAQWGLPNPLMYKERFSVPADTGLPDAERTGGKGRLDLWSYDERGSFNAVCGFLMKLGMRWYSPGELGEVVPSLKTIALPTINETVRPDFPMRRVNIRFGVHGPDLARWAMRLGVRDPYGYEIAHGMAQMTDREEIFARHPDWFALVGGKRVFKAGANNHLCYSNEELIAETVKRVRAELDQYHMEAVSIMPPDGYTSICQCDLCRGKDSPERDNRGLASDYIWGFVNRVAREVAKTHPGRKITNCAYGIYSLPPLKIAKLEPNVVVGIVGGRRLMNDRPEEMAALRQWRDEWQAKTVNPIFIFENYPFTDRGWYLPMFTPHAMGESINATKGISQGEDIWLSMPMKFDQEGGGYNHYLVWFTQRMQWGGPKADANALWREYVQLFYGPAAAGMQAFFDYCEANWREMEKEKDKADRALALFDQAKAQAATGTIYARRLALLDDFLLSLRRKADQLGRLRGPVPDLRLVTTTSGKIAIDGKLDEPEWVNCAAASTGRLRELQTGRIPTFATSVKSFWSGRDLYIAFRCEERRGEKPRATATRKDDAALWSGDAVEILLETESHSYYQIAISPNGLVADLDRSAPHDRWFTWDSNAEIATQVEDDHWTAEVRIPTTIDENDPLHQVIGHQPTKSLPWHINLCRQRVRDDGTEASAFSPTGAADFHHPAKFATFFYGNSHEFDHGPADEDFLLGLSSAAKLKGADLLAAYSALATGPYTPAQKDYALELSARAARSLRQLAVSENLITRIQDPAVKKTATMLHLLDTAQPQKVVEQFASASIDTWPFWKRGDAFLARGRAYFLAKSGPAAQADLIAALDWIGDPRQRDDALLLLGQNATANLHDDDAALRHFHQIIDGQKQLGSATQFDAIHGIAVIQARRGQRDAALATLRLVDYEKMPGVWGDRFRAWAKELAQ